MATRSPTIIWSEDFRQKFCEICGENRMELLDPGNEQALHGMMHLLYESTILAPEDMITGDGSGKLYYDPSVKEVFDSQADRHEAIRSLISEYASAKFASRFAEAET